MNNEHREHDMKNEHEPWTNILHLNNEHKDYKMNKEHEHITTAWTMNINNTIIFKMNNAQTELTTWTKAINNTQDEHKLLHIWKQWTFILMTFHILFKQWTYTNSINTQNEHLTNSAYKHMNT